MVPPAKILDKEYGTLYDSLKDNQLDIALLQRDIQQIRLELADIKEEIKSIKTYFVRAMIGLGSVVGLYVVQWILSGGLTHIVSTAPIQP